MELATRFRPHRVPVLVLALALLFTPLLNTTPAEGVSPGVDVVYVADGKSFADALVGAALAASHNTVVLTVEGTRSGDLVPQATKDELTRVKPKSIVILGGTSAVSQKVQNELAAYTDPPGTTSRIEGDDRYATAAAISKFMPNAVDKALFADEAAQAANADTLDGKDSSAFAVAGHRHGELFSIATGAEATTSQATVFDDVPGAAVQVTVPEGHQAVLLARFTAESACYNAWGYCSLRIVVNGTEMNPTMGADVFAFDSSDSGNEGPQSWESHAVDRSFGPVPAGTYTVKVQQRVVNDTVRFALDDWHLTVDAKLAD